jgi:Tfp pilus assembly protein PilV
MFMPDNESGITLIELIIAIVLMSLVLLGFFSIELFSNHHVISSDRRAKVQNEISYAIEHMSKYVQMSNGNFAGNAIRFYPGPSSAGATGFRVYVDLRDSDTQTPLVLTDDGWIDYSLSSNTLTATCTANGGTCPFSSPETLSTKIISGVVADNTMPQSPGNGFYVRITDQGAAVDVGLVGRFSPAAASSPENPQISMKTRLVSPSSSAQ